LSTLASRKRRLTLGALTLALATYGGLALGLGRLAVWAESRFEAYPYRGGEEPIRWLMPTTFSLKPDVLIVGPSAVGEDLLYEVISRAMGGRVVSAALSNGTLDDISIALEYVERVHGAVALPGHVVLGMTPRVLANFPRNFGPPRWVKVDPFLIELINKYSPEYKVRSEHLGSVLSPKSTPERWSAYYQWVTKQQNRHRTAVLAAIEYLGDPEPVKIGYQEGLPYFTDLRTPMDKTNWRTTVRFVRTLGIREAVRRWLPAYRSAYYHSFMKPSSLGTIENQVQLWQPVYGWEPLAEEDMVRFQLRRLRSILGRHDVILTIIHLPEHPLSRAEYNPIFYAQYREMIAEELPEADIIDLWEAPAEMFYDQIHLTYQGAEWMTDQVASTLVRSLQSDQ
jgi:hypothetical protein